MTPERELTGEQADAVSAGAFDSAAFPDLGATDPFASLDSDATGSGAESSRPDRSSPTGYASAGVGPAVSINGSSGSGEADTTGRDDNDEPWRVTRLAYGRHIRMLLVESDPEEAAAFARAATESVLDVRIESVTDPEATLARLERSLGHRNRRPAPDVVVVALATPAAHRLLEMLQDDTRFDDLPVLVLAKTSTPEAERRSFALGAAAHLISPRQDYERVALLHALPDFIPRARAAHAHLESRR